MRRRALKVDFTTIKISVDNRADYKERCLGVFEAPFELAVGRQTYCSAKWVAPNAESPTTDIGIARKKLK